MIRARKCPTSIPKSLRDLALKHHIGVSMKCTSQGPIFQVFCPGGGEVGYARTTVRAAMSLVRHAADTCRR